jgi:hypothetical protein
VLCQVDTSPAAAEKLVRDALDRASFGLAMIGGGIRLCFNTAPDNTVEALRRWITPRP